MESELASSLQQADSSGPSLMLFPPLQLPVAPPSTSVGFTPQGILPCPQAPHSSKHFAQTHQSTQFLPAAPRFKGVVPWARTVSFIDTLVSPL